MTLPHYAIAGAASTGLLPNPWTMSNTYSTHLTSEEHMTQVYKTKALTLVAVTSGEEEAGAEGVA